MSLSLMIQHIPLLRTTYENSWIEAWSRHGMLLSAAQFRTNPVMQTTTCLHNTFIHQQNLFPKNI